MDSHADEAIVLTAIIDRLIASKGDMNCVWMNINHVPTALKYYDSLSFHSKHILDEVVFEDQ